MNLIKLLPLLALFVFCVLATAEPVEKRQNYPADLGTIIDGGSQILGGEYLDDLKSVLSNANSLLTPEFVNNTLTIINTLGPVSLVIVACKAQADKQIQGHWRDCPETFAAVKESPKCLIASRSIYNQKSMRIYGEAYVEMNRYVMYSVSCCFPWVQ